jgi:hypothetical protein
MLKQLIATTATPKSRTKTVNHVNSQAEWYRTKIFGSPTKQHF